MLKQTAIFLTALSVFVGVFLLVERTSSPFFQKCISEESGNKGEHAANESNASIGPIITVYVRCSGRFMDGHGVGLTAIASFIIAAFTATLWIATRQQGALTKDSIELARKEFVVTHRPKVIIRFIQGPWQDVIAEQKFQYIWITLVNVGESVATIGAIGADLARKLALPRGHEDEWSSPGLDAAPKPVEAIILKSGERYSFKVIAKSPYTESELFEDVQETHLLCAVGGVRYADSQGLVRETGFHRVFKERDGFVPSKNAEDEYQD